MAALSAAPPLPATVSVSTDILDAPVDAETGLSHSNGNKIAVGAFNLLHATFEYGGLYYLTGSADSAAPNGVSWAGPAVIAPWTSAPRYPAIAADGYGDVGVVWVSEPGADGLGTIRYSFRQAGSPITDWTTRVLADRGTEPAIVARGGTVYVTWTTYDSVRHLTFPTTSPPATPDATVEVLASSSCPGTSLHKPSIALLRRKCAPPVPRIAFLYARDDQVTKGPCQSPETVIGPHVYQRDSPYPTWSLVFDGTRSDASPGAVDPVALSLSANSSSDHTFLAWSDEQAGDARTMLAHGHGSLWDQHLFESARRHVHVRAGATAELRLAWTGGNPLHEFFGWQTYYDTATWTGAAPDWQGATHLSDITEGGGAGRPQAVFWKRCQAGTRTTLEAFFSAESPCGGIPLHVQTTHLSPCPPPGIGVAEALCERRRQLVSGTIQVEGVPGSVFETSEIGPVGKVGSDFVEILAGEGKVVRVSWPKDKGKLLWWSDSSFASSATAKDLRIEGDVEVEVHDVGHLKEYDGLAPAKAAPAKCG